MQGALPHPKPHSGPGKGVHKENRGRVPCQYVSGGLCRRPPPPACCFASCYGPRSAPCCNYPRVLATSMRTSFASCLPYRILDNLPVAIRKMREENGHPFKTYERGFPVGRMEV